MRSPNSHIYHDFYSPPPDESHNVLVNQIFPQLSFTSPALSPSLPAEQFSATDSSMAQALFPQGNTTNFNDDFNPGGIFELGDTDQTSFAQQNYPSPLPWSYLTDGSGPQKFSPAQLQYLQYQQYQQQQKQRALSTSSGISAGSDSPYSRASSIQYPTTASHPSQRFSSPWEAYNNSPMSAAQHLPTPTHTPVKDTFMDRKDGGNELPAPPAPVSQHPRRSIRAAGQLGSTPQYLSAQSREDSSLGDGSGAQYGPICESMFGIGGNEDDDSLYEIAARHIPTFDRTISDAYRDELYNPTAASQAPSSAPQQAVQGQAGQTAPSLMYDRLQEANLARSLNQQGMSSYRDDIGGNSYGSFPSQFSTAAGLRQQAKRESDYMAYQQHHPSTSEAPATTVSPKDAFPEEPEPEEDAPSLFPDASSQQEMNDAPVYGPPTSQSLGSNYNFHFSMPSSSSGIAASSMPSASPAPNTDSYHQNFNDRRSQISHPTPSLQSMDSIKSEESETSSVSERPKDTKANGGVYSCTYHGCPERFESPAKLQKHKREDHRSTASHKTDMTQAGPHKCNRINPSTGKPCNTVFSRPYDLTRHEFSLHSAKKKLRCIHCTDEKLFSRQDALTRHMRVCHTNVTAPGKTRRRLAH